MQAALAAEIKCIGFPGVFSKDNDFSGAVLITDNISTNNLVNFQDVRAIVGQLYKKIYTNKLRKRILKETTISDRNFITNYKDIKRYFKGFRALLKGFV